MGFLPLDDRGLVMIKKRDTTTPTTVGKEGRGGRGEKMVVVKRAGTTCPSPSSLYTFPSQSSTVDASAGPLVFTWNKACLDPSVTKVDLSLYAPALVNPVMKVWTGIPASDGSYSTTLLPKWWNSTETIQLQVTLSSSDNTFLPSFLANTVAGPVFTVTYPRNKLVTVVAGGSTVAAAAADTAIVDPVYTTASLLTKGGLNAGSVFAAVFFPIVIFLAGIFVYVRWARAKQSKKRERWSKAIDNRMSVISTSWNPASASSPDPRKSISSAANRRTQVGSFYETTYDVRPSQSSSSGPHSPSHLRNHTQTQEIVQTSTNSFARPATSVFLATGEQRASRVSFAFAETPNNRVSFAERGGGGNKTSPSPREGTLGRDRGRGVSQVGRPSISIYSGDDDGHGGNGNGMMKQTRTRTSDDMVSPDQAEGPWVLGSAEEVEEELSSMAAVRMMNGASHHNPTASSSSNSLRFPLPAHTLPNITTSSPKTSNPSSYFPNPTIPTSASASPDAMLRNYAGGGKNAGRRMTVLGKPGVGENNPFRKSMAGEISEGLDGGAEEYGQAR